MSQKSILSFFKSPSNKTGSNKLIESDKKTAKSPNSAKKENQSSKTEKHVNEASKTEGTANSEPTASKVNGVSKSNDSENLQPTPLKVNGASKSDETEDPQPGGSGVEVKIPLRKTARKSIRGVSIVQKVKSMAVKKAEPDTDVNEASEDSIHEEQQHSEASENVSEDSVSLKKTRKKKEQSKLSSDSNEDKEPDLRGGKKGSGNIITDDTPVKKVASQKRSAKKGIKKKEENKKSQKMNSDKESHKKNSKKNSASSPEQKNTKKRKNVVKSESSASSDEEIPQPAKRGRKNVIVDDSPIKKRQAKTIVSDESMEEEEAEDSKEEAMEQDVKDETLNEENEKEDSSKKANKKDSNKNTTDARSPAKKSTLEGFFTSSSKNSSENKKSAEVKVNGKTTKTDEVYNPSKSNYHPIDDACWKRGEKVPYLALARTLEEIEAISARLKMIEILANFYRSVIVLSPDDLLYSVYLCLNRIAPEYEGVEMGVGDTLLMKAVAQSTGRTLDKIKAEVASKGDLGLVAESSRGNQRVMFAFPKLTVAAVFAKFKEIALMSGNSVMSKKTDKIQALFSACRLCEARYLIRSLSGKLRIGLAEQSILAALAQAAVLTPPNQSYPPDIINTSSGKSAETFKKHLDEQILILKTTYCECPNYDVVLPVLLREGISGLPKHCHLTAGVPLKPMLAHPTKGVTEVLKRFTDDSGENYAFTCEFKYDGERAQIHLKDTGEVKIYSRNQEDNTTKYPDVVSRINKAFKAEVKSLILDSEAVAWDKETKEILPFQVLSTRKRKDAADSEIKVEVCIMGFDLLYLNGESLVKKSLKERRNLLKEFLIEVPGEFQFAQSMDGNSADVMQEFLSESIKGKCEGLMVKSLEVDATYEIAKRSHNWLKLKKDYLDGVGDTLDLIVIGGWYGKGKRTGNFGGFLLACYDLDTDEYQTICKIGTGLKDADLDAHTKFFNEHIIDKPQSDYRYDSSLEPDVWFEAVQVWEVKCADLSISPIHKAAAGLVDPEKGISLRFPRFIRIRDDKKSEDVTTAAQVADMYKNQDQIKDQKKNVNVNVDDEEFY